MILFANIMAGYEAPATIGAWLGCLLFIVMLYNACAKAWDNLTGRSNIQKISPQPLAVELTKELHEQFADKDIFQKQKEHCTSRHGQLFNKIDNVERATRNEIDRRFLVLQDERRETLKALDQRINRISIGVARLCGRLNVIMPKEDDEI